PLPHLLMPEYRIPLEQPLGRTTMPSAASSRLAAALVLALCVAPAIAKVTPDQAAKLGTELTPVGAEKGANADGSIPAWTPLSQHGKLKDEFANDPAVEAEKPQFTITKANMAQYDKFLTEGHKKLLGMYDSYKMNVYKSLRDVNWPAEIMAATKDNATTAPLSGTDVVEGAKLGFPFPIP